MSAQRLRAAAAAMRARATHPDVSASPWEASPHGDVHDDGSLWVCDTQSGETADHIASWHPAVALAVADWLDMVAGNVENYGPNVESPWVRPHVQRALAVADAYLSPDP